VTRPDFARVKEAGGFPFLVAMATVRVLAVTVAEVEAISPKTSRRHAVFHERA
jgi:hypothetical protein